MKRAVRIVAVRKRFRAIIAIALCGWCVNTSAAEWVAVGSMTNGNIVQIDRQSIVTMGPNARRAWFKTDYSPASTQTVATSDGIKTIGQIKELDYVDCREMRSAIKQAVWYDRAGNVIKTASTPDSTSLNYEASVPESIGELMVRFACYEKAR